MGRLCREATRSYLGRSLRGDPAGKSAEAIVVEQASRGLEDTRSKHEHRKTRLSMKGQTSSQRSDRVEGEHPVTASRPGSVPSRHEGKHGSVEDDSWMGRVLAPENLQQA